MNLDFSYIELIAAIYAKFVISFNQKHFHL